MRTFSTVVSGTFRHFQARRLIAFMRGGGLLLPVPCAGIPSAASPPSPGGRPSGDSADEGPVAAVPPEDYRIPGFGGASPRATAGRPRLTLLPRFSSPFPPLSLYDSTVLPSGGGIEM